MSESNPKASLKALFPKPIDCGLGVEVMPLTLGHYALLEKIGSYLVSGDHTPDSMEVVRTYYVCTHSAKEVLADFDNLDARAFDWAETLPPSINAAIANAILEQIDAMSKVVPIVGDDKKKVPGTDS